jgi:alkylation response protein AidB-like acyl-CoA dehydrogenase
VVCIVPGPLSPHYNLNAYLYTLNLGAVNPRDNDSVITRSPSGDGLVLNGFKNFNTGGVVSDLTVLEGVYEDTGNHIFAVVPTNQPGIIFLHNWNNIGLRLTESGSVKLENIPISWEDALGWSSSSAETETETKAPIPEILQIPFASLLLPAIQLMFSNFYIGIASGALRTAAEYTRTQTRAWPFAHDPKGSPAEEHYVLARYGKFFASLRAAEALADRAGAEIAAVFGEYGSSTKRDRLTARQRGEVAEWVASVKVVATHVSLEVTSGIFEVTGARSTSEKYGFDRFWKDVRTHTLHDPVAYKETELGKFFLLDEVPTPTWYT